MCQPWASWRQGTLAPQELYHSSHSLTKALLTPAPGFALGVAADKALPFFCSSGRAHRDGHVGAIVASSQDMKDLGWKGQADWRELLG